jgi:hypothetical protein
MAEQARTARYNLRSLGNVAQQVGQAAAETAQAVASQITERIISPVRSAFSYGASADQNTGQRQSTAEQQQAARPATLASFSSSEAGARQDQQEIDSPRSISVSQRIVQTRQTPEHTNPLRVDGSRVHNRPSDSHDSNAQQYSVAQRAQEASSREFMSPEHQRTDSQHSVAGMNSISDAQLHKMAEHVARLLSTAPKPQPEPEQLRAHQASERDYMAEYRHHTGESARAHYGQTGFSALTNPVGSRYQAAPYSAPPPSEILSSARRPMYRPRTNPIFEPPRGASGTGFGNTSLNGGERPQYPSEIEPATASPEVSQGQEPRRDLLLSTIRQTWEEIPLTVNQPGGVRVTGGRNVSMNLPLPERFDPEKDSWHTWKKSLIYFFRTIRLPDILTEYGSEMYSLDVHSNVITLLMKIIPESDRAWIVERDDQDRPDTVYNIWKYLDLRYGTRNQMRLHEKLIAYEHVQQGPQESTIDYVLRLKRTVEELATLGHAVDPLTHKLKLLRLNPTAGTGQDVHDMFVSTLRTMITTLSTEEIEDKLIMHQQSLHEQKRATQNAKGVYAAGVFPKTQHPKGAMHHRKSHGLDDATRQALLNYDRSAAWKKVDHPNECAMHKQLGLTYHHKTKYCPLREAPEAAPVVQHIDERMQQYRTVRQAARPQANGAGPSNFSTNGSKPIKTGGRNFSKRNPKSVRFK